MSVAPAAADAPGLRAPPSIVTVYVCVTCRADGAPPADDRPGARLCAALDARLDSSRDPLIKVAPVECLSICKRPCSIAFAAPGKWTYVYGDLSAETSADTILAGARLYAEADDGIIPWKLRPAALKTGVVARVPPLDGRGGG